MPTDREREKLVDAMRVAYFAAAAASGRPEEGTRAALSAALTVAEAAFERRERHEPRGCPAPGACSCTRAEAAIRANEREACAKVAEDYRVGLSWAEMDEEFSDDDHVWVDAAKRAAEQTAAAIRAREAGAMTEHTITVKLPPGNHRRRYSPDGTPETPEAGDGE